MENILSGISGKLNLVKEGATATLGNVSDATTNDELPNKGQMDAAIELAVFAGGSVLPTSPSLYQRFFLIPDGDNTDGKLYIWNGSSWV